MTPKFLQGCEQQPGDQQAALASLLSKIRWTCSLSEDERAVEETKGRSRSWSREGDQARRPPASSDGSSALAAHVALRVAQREEETETTWRRRRVGPPAAGSPPVTSLLFRPACSFLCMNDVAAPGHKLTSSAPASQPSSLLLSPPHHPSPYL